MKMGRIVDSLKESIRQMSHKAMSEIRAVAVEYAQKAVDRMLNLVLHADHASGFMRGFIKNIFVSNEKRINNMFRTWRTTFTNKWRKKGGDIAEKTFKTIVRWRWICTFNNSRDSHMDMHLQERDNGDPFLSGAGNELRYPGDRNAPIEEWINCQCYLVMAGKRRVGDDNK